MLEQGFGGWMVWSLDFDDFGGTFCKAGKNPLLHAMVKATQDFKTNQTQITTSTIGWNSAGTVSNNLTTGASDHTLTTMSRIPNDNIAATQKGVTSLSSRVTMFLCVPTYLFVYFSMLMILY